VGQTAGKFLQGNSAAIARFKAMKRFRLPIFASFMVASIAACDAGDPVDKDANAIGPAEVTETSAGKAAGGPPPAAGSGVPGTIPTAIQGRWGITPADCVAGPGDAQGLLTIGPEEIKFYESRATPGTSIEAKDNGISGNWNFSGEGETWSEYVSLKLQDDGLVRTERNPPTTYTYARCD
jgi:hypothetical protein